MKNKLVVFVLAAIALMALPLVAQQLAGWVRIMATSRCCTCCWRWA
jgi:hypothetical protein